MKQGRSLKAAKAERAAKKRRAKRRKRIIVLLVEILILIILLCIGYVMLKYDKVEHNPFEEGEIQKNEGVDLEGYTTIALFGGDSREGELEEGTHADTIMLVSIDDDSKEVRIASVYRDLIIKRPDGELGKANSAYFYGGSKDAINMLNQNFDLNIEDYVTVNFSALAEVVDMLGGIEIDVTDEEATEMNRHMKETAEVVGKKAKRMSSGMQTLDGVQAVTYARIRKNVGGDYARTERQRVVIQKLAEKVKKTDLIVLNNIIDAVLSNISTSISLEKMTGLASDAFAYEICESKGYAFEYMDGNVKGIGSVIIPLGVKENVEELHQFLYPKEEYIASDTVIGIAQEIESVTGYTRKDNQE